MQVRLLRPTDVQIAKQLLRQLGYEVATDEVIGRIDRVLASRNHYAAVVEDREKVLGLVHVYERPALEKPCEAVVQALIVDGSLRKTGVGRILMAAAEAWARAKGLTCLVLHTRDDREDARAFYEHLGYQKARDFSPYEQGPGQTDLTVVCTENLNPNVLTMKSAQYRARIYDAGSLNLARDRRILVQ